MEADVGGKIIRTRNFDGERTAHEAIVQAYKEDR
jgi:hypothetical protein